MIGVVEVLLTTPPGPVAVALPRNCLLTNRRADGDFAVLVPPSPKFHDQLVTWPVVVLLKLTVVGAVPLPGLPLKVTTVGGRE